MQKELRQLNASAYIVSNGIRRQNKLIKWYQKMSLVYLILIVLLSVLALGMLYRYSVATNRLNATQSQLRYEAGQKASFEQWYETHCTGDRVDASVCSGVE